MFKQSLSHHFQILIFGNSDLTFGTNNFTEYSNNKL